MKFDKNIISRLEALTMLKLSEAEKDKLIPELNKIVQMMDKLGDIDTEGLQPLYHLSPEVQKLRKDIITEMLDSKKALDNAEVTKDNYFTVPKVIK
jgi:aspartyl-tRNA(Asn)/glutamyl-tRNA(Gln) amidotransferase subunit C